MSRTHFGIFFSGEDSKVKSVWSLALILLLLLTSVACSDDPTPGPTSPADTPRATATQTQTQAPAATAMPESTAVATPEVTSEATEAATPDSAPVSTSEPSAVATQAPTPDAPVPPAPDAPALPPSAPVQTDSGLIYIDVVLGTGDVAEPGTLVTVHYTGMLTIDNSVFDSSVERGQPFQFALGAGNVIDGWEEGVAGMKVGGKRHLIIPPDLAYGERGFGDVIPPDSYLTFDVDLLDVSR